MQRGNVFLSIAEEEIVRHLAHYMVTDMGKESKQAEIDAVEQVIQQKRELAYIHGRRGNLALARHIKQELGEWSKEDEEHYQSIERKLNEVKK